MFISERAIRRPVLTTTVFLAVIVFGLVSFTRLGIDMMPNVEFPVVTILTVYPGADPETVEREVSEKLEEAVSTINGVRNLRSMSAESVSQVIIEFELEVPSDRAVQDVRDKVSGVVQSLPADVELPKVQRFDFGSAPVLQLAVGGPGTIDEITLFARKRVKEQIQQIPGVGSVDIIGGQERQIRVWVDPEKLDAVGIAVTDVVQALMAQNLQFPGGRLKAGGIEFVVNVDGELKSLDAIRDLVILESKAKPITIGDVARVEDGLEDERSAARLNGKRAVTLLIRKQSGTNSVEVGDRVKARLEEIRETFPPGWQVLVAADSTTFIKTMVEHVEFDIVFGGVLAVLVVFLFLRNLRSTLIAAVAIPTSLIGTLTFIKALGFTFNTLTLLALSLSIGILIDDAIVVIENIYRRFERGQKPNEAAASGAAEIGLAVLATTLSIVAVFVPVAFMRGIVGRFFYQFGITVAVAVLISLVVSLTLTPMMSAKFMGETKGNAVFRVLERFLSAVDRGYRSIIGWALRHRFATVLFAVMVFVASLTMGVLFLKTEFKPGFDMGELNISVKMPTGTALEQTSKLAEEIATRVRGMKGIVLSTVASVGSDAQKKQNLAAIYVKLTEKNRRSMSQSQVMSRLRAELSGYGGATISVEEVNWVVSGMANAKIQVGVRGGDLAELDRVTRRLASELGKIHGFVDLTTSYEGGKPEVRVFIDRDRASRLKVMTAQVGQAIHVLVGGVEASKFREKGEDSVILVQLEEANRRSPEQIARLKVRNLSDKLVELANVTRIDMGSGPTQIDRQSRQRQIMIMGNLDPSLTLGDAVPIIKRLAARVVPKNLTVSFEGEARHMKESFDNMIFSLILAIIMVYLVLAAQFESYLHPLTIMVSLPMSVVGAFGALLLTGGTLSIISMIGIIMLMGLVTKNAILLIDYTNTLRRRDGMERNDAILKAGPIRLRPILMTTFAMVFGMMPVALSRGYASEMRSPMAVCVIGGLIASTLLTLVVVPVVYSLFDDASAFLKAKLSKTPTR